MWTEKTVERIGLRAVADLTVAKRSPADDFALEDDLSRGRAALRREHSESRTLAGAVDSQEAEATTGLDPETQTLYRNVFPVNAPVLFSQTNRSYRVVAAPALHPYSLPHHVLVLRHVLVRNPSAIETKTS